MRPKRPSPNLSHPTKETLALELLESFSRKYPEVNVKIITADAPYGTGSFMDKSNQYFPHSQVATQLRKKQSVRCKNGRRASLKSYLSRNEGVEV